MSMEALIKKLNLLNPKEVKVLLDDNGRKLTLIVNGKVLPGLTPAKPFPITYPKFIIFRDSANIDICMIKNYEELDPESKSNLEKVLDRIYFIPKIRKIESIKTSGDEFVWNVQTEKGPREFRTYGRRSLFIVGNRIVIIDIHDNIYEIVDINTLDSKSMRELEYIL